MSILDDIYDAVADEDALARLPGALSNELQARSCLVELFSPNGDLVNCSFNNFKPEIFEFYIDNEMYKFDVWIELGKRPTLFNTIVNSDDFFDINTFRQSVMYNEMFRLYGDDTARFLGGCFSVGDHTLVVGLHRALGQETFAPGQISHLQDISAHLRRLFTARQTLGRANARADQMAAALDAPLIGIIRVDLRGRLVHANAAGDDIIRLRDGFALVGQAIVIEAPYAQKRFAEAIRTAALRSGGQGDALLVPRPSGKRPWRVVIAPSDAHACGFATLLIEPAGGDDGLPARLAVLYDLTPAESEVGALLVDGVGPAEIAGRRGVSLETVRNQIKALLQKTGAPRLGALIALLARTVRTH